MNTISSTIVGAAGEYHVLSQLLRRGWIAALAPDGAPNMDILVTDENNNKLCAIQVKTRRDVGSDRGWHMKPKHESATAPDLFYVFVDVGKQPSDPTISYILPSEVVAECLRRCHKVWLARIFHEGARVLALACFSGAGAGVSDFLAGISPPGWDVGRFWVVFAVFGRAPGLPVGLPAWNWLCWECGVIRVSAGRRPGGKGPARGRRRTGGSAPAWYCG